MFDILRNENVSNVRLPLTSLLHLVSSLTMFYNLLFTILLFISYISFSHNGFHSTYVSYSHWYKYLLYYSTDRKRTFIRYQVTSIYLSWYLLQTGTQLKKKIDLLYTYPQVLWRERRKLLQTLTSINQLFLSQVFLKGVLLL